MNDQEFAPDNTNLPKHETRFHLLLDTIPLIAFVIAPEGNAQYYNRRFVEYHGFVPGNDTASRTSLLHPDDRSRLVTTRRSGVASTREYTVEARLRRHDGVYRWHSIHNKPLIRGGNLAGWFGTAVDIHDAVHANELLERRVNERTEELEAANRHLVAQIAQRKRIEEGLRASEARYRLLYNRTPMALQSVDAQARLIDVNDTWLDMFDHTRETVIGHSPAEFMLPASAEQYRAQAWPGMLVSRGQSRVVDYQFVTRSGRIFDGRLAASGEFDGEGQFVRSWSAIADVTAEKRADRDLRQAQRMEAVGQLTAGIAHDFNNLLTAILGNLELLSKPQRSGHLPSDPARQDRLIAGARSAAQRGAKLTGQLLAFSRQQRIAAEPVDLNCVIQGMATLLRSSIGGNIGINITPNPKSAIALADPTQLELAILNLAINARDAMPGGGTITIETATAALGEPTRAEEPAAGNYVAVRVSDTGTGIPDDVRERMFEPFFTTKEIGKGSGLGLPQVLGVVKQLGGGLAVRSRLGEGSSISIFLPCAGVCAAADVTASSDHVADEATSERVAPILLVDDDADVRSIAAAMLDDAGYEVVEATSGASALDALERAGGQIALVLADVAMPGINGVDFAAIVRRTWPVVSVLLMTGYANSDLLREGDGQEALRKPFTADELRKTVARMMTHKRNGRTDLGIAR